MIVDASVGVKWLLQETDGDLADKLLARLDLAAPDLLRLEVGHVLGKLYRRREVSAQFVRDAWAELDETPLRFQPSGELFDSAFRLSAQLGAAIYDCVYLAMAEVADDVLVTADEGFARTVRQAGLPDLGGRIRLLSEFR